MYRVFVIVIFVGLVGWVLQKYLHLKLSDEDYYDPECYKTCPVDFCVQDVVTGKITCPKKKGEQLKCLLYNKCIKPE